MWSTPHSDEENADTHKNQGGVKVLVVLLQYSISYSIVPRLYMALSCHYVDARGEVLQMVRKFRTGIYVSYTAKVDSL